jgi:hypothetical protein
MGRVEREVIEGLYRPKEVGHLTWLLPQITFAKICRIRGAVEYVFYCVRRYTTLRAQVIR